MPGFPGNVVAGEQFAVVESVEGKVWTEAFAVGYVSVADVESDLEVFVVDGEVVEGYAEVDVAVVERDKEVVVVENDEFVAVVEGDGEVVVVVEGDAEVVAVEGDAEVVVVVERDGAVVVVEGDGEVVVVEGDADVDVVEVHGIGVVFEGDG